MQRSSMVLNQSDIIVDPYEGMDEMIDSTMNPKDKGNDSKEFYMQSIN